MNRRLIILIIGALLVIALVAMALMWAAGRQNGSQEETPTGPQIIKLSEEVAISPIPSFDNNAIWYFTEDGRLFRMNTDGTGITEYPIPALGTSVTLRRALWPKSGSDFIAVSLSQQEEIKSYYNSTAKLYTRLPANVQSLDWMPDSRRVAYIWRSSNGLSQQLVIANSDGSGFVPVKDVFWPDLQIKVAPDGLSALLYRSQIQGGINKIYGINLVNGEMYTVVDQGENLAATWISPTRFLFSQSSVTDYPRVYMHDVTTKKSTDLGINTSLDKVAADYEGIKVYAATPKKDSSGDKFVSIDLSNFALTDYFNPEGVVSARNLMLINTELYFVNTSDNKLYRIAK